MRPELIPIEVVRFCAVECRMQMSGEISVWNMIEAWRYCVEQAELNNRPSVANILEIGKLVEPTKNYDTFRKVDVRVGWDVKMAWEDVPVFMVNTVDALHHNELTNEAFIYESLGICHPFVDGNGRTHQLLWNWLEGTLDNPTWHKDFWNDPRRTIGYGA